MIESDVTGQYVLQRIPAGDYTVTVFVPGEQGEMIPSEPLPIAMGNSGTQLLDWTY